MRPIDLATANGFTSMARFIQQRTKDTVNDLANSGNLHMNVLRLISIIFVYQ